MTIRLLFFVALLNVQTVFAETATLHAVGRLKPGTLDTIQLTTSRAGKVSIRMRSFREGSWSSWFDIRNTKDRSWVHPQPYYEVQGEGTYQFSLKQIAPGRRATTLTSPTLTVRVPAIPAPSFSVADISTSTPKFRLNLTRPNITGVASNPTNGVPVSYTVHRVSPPAQICSGNLNQNTVCDDAGIPAFGATQYRVTYHYRNPSRPITRTKLSAVITPTPTVVSLTAVTQSIGRGQTFIIRAESNRVPQGGLPFFVSVQSALSEYNLGNKSFTLTSPNQTFVLSPNRASTERSQGTINVTLDGNRPQYRLGRSASATTFNVFNPLNAPLPEDAIQSKPLVENHVNLVNGGLVFDLGGFYLTTKDFGFLNPSVVAGNVHFPELRLFMRPEPTLCESVPIQCYPLQRSGADLVFQKPHPKYRKLKAEGEGYQLLSWGEPNWRYLVLDAEGRVSRIVAENEITTINYDSAKRISSVQSPYVRLTYTYRPNGLLQSISDGGLGTTSFDYDAQARLIGLNGPTGNRMTTLLYDAASRPQYIVDEYSQVTDTFSYDSDPTKIQQIARTFGPGGPDIESRLLFSYSPGRAVLTLLGELPLVYTFNPQGDRQQITSIGNQAQTTSFQYDSLGRPLSTTRSVSPRNGLASRTDTVTYTYSGQHPFPTRTRGPGFTLSATYNSDGYLEQITDENTQVATTFTRGSNNEITRATTRNIVTAYNYTSNGCLTSEQTGTSLTEYKEFKPGTCSPTKVTQDGVETTITYGSIQGVNNVPVQAANPYGRRSIQVVPSGNTYGIVDTFTSAWNETYSTLRRYNQNGEYLGMTDNRGFEESVERDPSFGFVTRHSGPMGPIGTERMDLKQSQFEAKARFPNNPNLEQMVRTTRGYPQIQ